MSSTSDIDIPPHFLCPISLQLMRDPVTIPTGITYDRESIERWLFGGTSTFLTCPVTKLPLSATLHLLIPNHNLRRLIQSWCTLHSSHGVERIPTPKAPLDFSQVAELIEDATRHHAARRNCLQRLMSIASGSERNRMHLQAAGAVAFLASVILGIRSNTGDNDDCWASVADALFVLHQINPTDAQLLRSPNTHGNDYAYSLVDSLTHVLRRAGDHGDDQSRARAVAFLRRIYSVADPNQLMSASPDLFVETVRTIKYHADQPTTSIGITTTAAAARFALQLKPAMKLLLELNPWGRNRAKAAKAGAVGGIVEILLRLLGDANYTAAAATERRRMIELALLVLDQMCGCAEGRAELVGHAAGVAVVAKAILRVSNASTDRAVKVLGALARHCGGSERVVAEMAEVGAVAKLCLVVQVDSCGVKTKERAKEILRLHSRAWMNSPCLPPLPQYSIPSS